MEITYFNRSREEDRLLAIYDSTEEKTEDNSNLKEEVLQFPTNCPNCGAPAFTNMKVTRKWSQTCVFPSLTVYLLLRNSSLQGSGNNGHQL